MNENYGKLYIVATPIGNMADITFRAIDVLKSVDIILSEDTRNTKKLLNHYNIEKKIISYYEHNKYEKEELIINLLYQNQNIALVTDAGTPIISDPGFEIVKKLTELGIKVESIPGPCAIINAVVLCAIDCREFIFLGFLPNEKKQRIEKLEEVKEESKTIIIYIQPHKFIKYLYEMINIFGEDRNVSVCREMTKIHEEIINDNIKKIYELFSQKEIKGEIVLVVEGINKNKKKLKKIEYYNNINIDILYNKFIDDGYNEKEAIKKIAKLRNVDKNEIYKMIKIKGERINE